jgi:hypothetical protein
MNAANDAFVRSVQALKAWLQFLDEQERDLQGKLARMKQNGKNDVPSVQPSAETLIPPTTSEEITVTPEVEPSQIEQSMSGNEGQEDPWL